MVHSPLVSHRNELNSLPAHIIKGKEGSSFFARQKRDGASSAQTSEPIGYFSFRSTLRGFELPEDTWALINSSWRDSTKCQYNSALRKWLSYCTERSVDSASPSINDVLTFFTHLYNTGLSYSTISSVKSVLSTLIHIPGITKIAEHPLVKRLMTGIFNSRPTLPRYNFTWDTSIVINFLKRLDYDNLSHKLLSYKVAALLTILSGQRVSTVHKFRLSQLHITKDIAIFTIPSLLKHIKPGRVNLPVTFHKYPYDDLLCPVMLLNKYISYRESLSLGDTDELIITFGKPYHPASKDTIARWIKDLMRISGVDTDIFKPHSCRSASTSKAHITGVSIDNILKCGQWSSDSTFYKFYCRNIDCYDYSGGAEFSNSILSSAHSA